MPGADGRVLEGAPFRLLAWLAIMVFWWAGTAAGQSKPTSQGLKLGDDGEPIEVRADRLRVAHREGRIEFTGKVVTKKGDITIHSDTLKVMYRVKGEEEPDALEGGRIESITAEGNVRILQGDRVATGRRADYLEEEKKIVLTGEPRIWQGKSFVSGKKIVVYLEEERSEVVGDEDEPVRATIHTSSKGKEKSPETKP